MPCPIAAWAAIEAYARMVGAPSTFRHAAAVLLLAAFGQQFYYAAFSSWYLWNWYYYLQYLGIAAIVARGGRIRPRPPTESRAAAC